MKHREAASAVIVHDGKILCLRKGAGKRSYDAFKYEFPGGKVEKGENPESAAAREVMEEIGMEVTVGEKLAVIDHTYPDMHISMHVFRCSCHDPEVTLTEHTEFLWLRKDQLEHLDWAAAEWKVVEVLVSESI